MNNPSNKNYQDDDGVSARVADIQRTIGDMAEVFNALKQALTNRPIPTCPPYCAHGIDHPKQEEVPLADRVADIEKCIGDFGAVFDAVKGAVNRMRPPTCPPYCAHRLGDDE